MTSPAHTGLQITGWMWQATIGVLSAAVIIFTVWCLTHGITIIFMHLYYFPIVLLAYHYRWKGCGLASLLALVYLGLVVVFCPGQPDVINAAVFRFLIFIGIAAIIAYLSEQILRSQRTEKQSTALKEQYISLAPAIILVLDRDGVITYLNEKGCAILECPVEGVIGKRWVDTFIKPDERDAVSAVFSRIIEGNPAPYEMVEGGVVTGSGTTRLIRWYNSTIRDGQGSLTGVLSYGEDITEEKAAQDSLTKMQQFQESVIANANVWISVLAPDGTILVWNDAAEQISGYKKTDVIGRRNVWKLLYPSGEYRKNVTRDINRIISRETYLENFETDIHCADGITKTIVWNTRALRDEQGSVTSYIAIWRDVSAQKSAEVRAGESSRFLASMIDTLPMPVFFKDASGKYLGCNPPFEEYIGIKREDLTGKTVYDISPKDLADKYAAADQQLFENPVPQRYETQVLYADGTRHDVIFYKAPFFNKDGTLGGLIGSFLDITERKRMEDALHESESFNRSLVENLPEYLCVYGTDGRILYVNPASATALGYDADALAGTHVITYISEEYRDIAKEKMALRKAGDNSSYEIELISKNGLRRSVIVKATPIQYQNKPAVLLLLIDITDRKHAEEEIRLSNVTLKTQQETSPDGILIVDKSGKIISFNQRFIDIWGLPREVIASRIDEQVLSFVLGNLASPEEFLIRVNYLYEHREEKSHEEIRLKNGTVLERYSMPMLGENHRYFGRVWYFHDITDRKKAEDALRESEGKYRTLFENMLEGFAYCRMIYDEKGQPADWAYLSVNRSFERLTGLKDIEGKRVLEAIPDIRNLTPEIFDMYGRVASTGISETFEIDFKPLKSWLKVSAFCPEKGYFVAVFEDITERRESQDRIQHLLRVQEEQLRIINASPAVAFLWKAEENWPVETVSENISQFGYTPEDFISGRVLFSSIIHPEDLGPVGEEVGYNSGHHIDDYIQEYRIFGKNHELYWVTDYTHIRRDTTGKITHYEGIVLDISDRKNAEVALKETNDYLTSLFDYATAPIIVWDPEFRITRFNHAFEHLTGRNAQDVIGQHLSLLFPEESRETSLEQMRVTLAGIRWESVEIPILHVSGEVKTVLWNSATLYADDGKTVMATIAQGQDITERKRIEEIRKATESRLDSAMETGRLAWWEMDMPSGSVRFDDRKASMLGYSPAKFHHYTDFTSLLHPDDVEPAMQAMRSHLEGKEARYHVDYRIKTSSGEYRWYRDVGGITRRHADGAPATLTGVVIDITAAKQAEQEVRQSRQLFWDIINFLPDPTFVIDNDGNVVAWNRALEQLSGTSPMDILGKGDHEYSLWVYGKRRPTLIDLVLDPDKDSARLNYTDIRWEGRTVTAQAVITHSGTGRRIPLSLVASPLLNPEGRITGAIETMRDISRIKEAEEELARFNANLEKIIKERTQALHDEIGQRKHAEQEVQAALGYTRSVIEANPDLMVVLDKTGIILDVNTAAESLTGVAREKLIGSPYTLYLMDNSTPKDILAQLREKGRIEYTVQLQRADGHITPLSVNSTLFSGKDQTDIRIIVAAHDITRQKQDEAAIRAALEEQVLLLREVHHRVKNNLQIIISLTNLQMRQTDDPKVKQIMSETQNRVKAMSLVHEKLYRSTSLSQIDFADYTRFLATQLFSYFAMDTRRVRLDFALGKFMVDIVTAVPLGLLMNELISNSLKHAFPGGREGVISISGGCEGDLITLIVRDNGIGLPGDLDWKNTSSLGMRLVISLVDQVDGTITLDRENGTSFTITARRPLELKEDGGMALSGKA